VTGRALKRGMAALVTAVLLSAWTAPVLAAQPPERSRLDGVEAIVSFDAGRRAEALSEVRAAGGRLVRFLRSGTDALVVFPAGTKVSAVREQLAGRGAVRSVAPNGVLRPAWVPNDPLFPQQWALTSIRAPQAWDLTRGSATVKVAVIDSGVSLTHPDLAANLDLAHDWTSSGMTRKQTRSTRTGRTSRASSRRLPTTRRASRESRRSPRCCR